jgi:hypothetical protein
MSVAAIAALALTAEPRSLFRPDVLWRVATSRARQLDGPDLPADQQPPGTSSARSTAE